MSNVREDANIVTIENCLATIKPYAVKYWDLEKNDGLTPFDVRANSNRKYWWKCNDYDNHTWLRAPNNMKDCGCMYCSNRKMLVGFNDMWSSNPEQAKLLLNPDDGYKYMQQSNIKLDWKCSTCDLIIRNKTPNKVYNYGICCTICSPSTPLSERIMGSVFKKLNINYNHNKSTPWSQGKQYDFHIPSLNMIIETHGLQHFEQSGRGRTLEEEQENDRYKERLAKENGIEHYIVIDCRKSDFEWIKNNILNSVLVQRFPITEDTFYNLNLENSIAIAVWNKWNKGSENGSVIAKELGIDKATANKYLTIGLETGNCEKRDKIYYHTNILKFDLNFNYIESYVSPLNAAKSVDKNNSSVILQCCNGDVKYAYEHIWMFESKYEEIQDNIFQYELDTFKIIQLDKDFNYVNKYIIANHASKSNKIGRTAIIDCCENKRITAGGYYWIYSSNYIDFLNEEYKFKGD